MNTMKVIKARCQRHQPTRQTTGPTGRKRWLLEVTVCRTCGLLRPVEPTNYEQRDWLRRWNRHVVPA